MSSIMKKILAKWQSYRYRFVPWVAWNLRERTVRSVENVNQDKIISDHLVKETYVKLFSALEGNLPDQDRGEGHKLHGPEMERSIGARSRRSEVQHDGVSDRYYCHGEGTLRPLEEQISLAKQFFGRTCELSCGQKCRSTWTCRNSRGNYNGGDCLGMHQQSLTQRLLQYWTSRERQSLEATFQDCIRNQSLIKYLMSTGTLTSGDFENRGCSYHHYFHPSLSVHPPPPNVSQHHHHHYHHHDHHDHHHHHHHHSYCHLSYQRAQKFLKWKKNISNSVQFTHQQRLSTHLGQSKGNPSDIRLGEDLDPGAIIMHQTLGYAIGRRPSQIEGGGIGVYVTKGVVPKGVVVAMYPGTVYYPAEPILFQSIANPFIFRCLDGIHIDGNDKRLSKMIYRSCARRDRLGPYMFSDLSWLTSCPLNPMAVGQYVNNQHKGAPANVCYQEYDVPVDFPLKLRKYIPNTFYSTLPDVGSAGRSVRTVALVSLREIQCGEELLSSYFTLIY